MLQSCCSPASIPNAGPASAESSNPVPRMHAFPKKSRSAQGLLLKLAQVFRACLLRAVSCHILCRESDYHRSMGRK
ncbi:uncharacterized protein CLUP02_03151 [Colletotrichum lupini]|uniref:Uncharacterized protein n=1 Tax=Colletotrichum lupini TaxID=145971 RepID=A0A9Q8SIP5_9PEZI|nr:uncharacterized protein CLUP02_03151 [Colletotrichum lupini]UQC77680.1 hypothetical protein CLUP02_03151 [Colletotrichum lupini]